MIFRWSKIALIVATALFLTLVAFSNITDYDTNYKFTRHVLAMDTTFKSDHLMWRAITAEPLVTAAYILIIAWEAAAAVVCWLGAARCYQARHEPAQAFHQSKATAVAGLTLAFLLWVTGFITIGGEWFAMWQSPTWSGESSAHIFLTFTGIILIYVSMPDFGPE